ncbi:MAG: HEAT repeat domain-containing protein [Polyangiaceae bacterium]
MAGFVGGPSISTLHYAEARADEASLIKDLGGADDFRIRVTAALALGKTKSRTARPALEKALKDKHAAVRTAAAAGLTALGDTSAISALKTARGSESDSDVKTALDAAIKALEAKKNAKFLVQLGKLQNKTDLSSNSVNTAFRKAARERISSISGVELLADSDDIAAESQSRGLPAMILDGNLTKLQKTTSGSDVGYAAHVDFAVRKIPDQSLKATVGGDAKALASASSVGENELQILQVDAVTAATQSALKGAPSAIEAAAK